MTAFQYKHKNPLTNTDMNNEEAAKWGMMVCAGLLRINLAFALSQKKR